MDFCSKENTVIFRKFLEGIWGTIYLPSKISKYFKLLCRKLRLFIASEFNTFGVQKEVQVVVPVAEKLFDFRIYGTPFDQYSQSASLLTRFSQAKEIEK